MGEKFVACGCAPPNVSKWRIVTDQLNQEMNLVIQLDQVKTNFSTGLGGMDHVRKAAAIERMDVQIVTPENRNSIVNQKKPPSLPFMPNRSPALSNKGRSPGQRKPPVVHDRFGGLKPFQHHTSSDEFGKIDFHNSGSK